MKKFMIILVGLAIILGVCIFNQWLFSKLWGISYLGWYVKNGVIISLVTSAAAMAWGDLEKNTGLINPHPVEYLSACMFLIGLPIYALGTQTKSAKENRVQISFFDSLSDLVLTLALAAVLVAWLVLIAPLQYFVYLVCSAPARAQMKSSLIPIARIIFGSLEVKEIKKGDPIPAGYWNASFDPNKPLKITGLYATLFFFLLNLSGLKL